MSENNNNNTGIYKAHSVSRNAESEMLAVLNHCH